MRGISQRAASDHLRAPGIAGTIALHGALVATFVLAGGVRPHPRLPPVYRVNLVAPLGEPAPAPAPAPAAPASRPQVSRPAPPREAVPKPQPPSPRPVSRPPAPVAPGPAAPSQQAAGASPKPVAPAPSRAAPGPPTQPGSPSGQPGGTDVATVKTEGVEFPFPGYLNNLVSQVYRRWQPPSTSSLLQAEIFFFVHRDGSVTGLQFVRRSGSFSFDLEAEGAIESAARAGAFGPLPAGYGADMLPVSFYFNPRNVQ